MHPAPAVPVGALASRIPSFAYAEVRPGNPCREKTRAGRVRARVPGGVLPSDVNLEPEPLTRATGFHLAPSALAVATLPSDITMS